MYGLNFPIKRQSGLNIFKNKKTRPIYMLLTRDSLSFKNTHGLKGKKKEKFHVNGKTKQ